jgi:hypothetical protein
MPCSICKGDEELYTPSRTPRTYWIRHDPYVLLVHVDGMGCKEEESIKVIEREKEALLLVSTGWSSALHSAPCHLS